MHTLDDLPPRVLWLVLGVSIGLALAMVAMLIMLQNIALRNWPPVSPGIWL